MGHGLERNVAELMAVAQAFFDQPQEAKERIPRQDNYGFVPHVSTAIDTQRQSPNTEFLDLGLGDEVPWPDVPGFVATVRNYQRLALDVARVLLAAMATGLGVADETFDDALRDPQCRLRFLHYPPAVPGADGSQAVPTAPHTDYGALTLLATDGVPGLEVMSQGGDWTPVTAPVDALVVNLGDMLARWTNDVYRSTPHRVVGSASGDRISIPYFVNPSPATIVDCLPACVAPDRPCQYEPVTAGDFLLSRIGGATEPYIDAHADPEGDAASVSGARRAPIETGSGGP